MLDIKFIRENADRVKEAAKNKNIVIDIEQLLALDEKRREMQKEIDDLRAQRNELAEAGKSGKPTAEQIEQGKQLKAAIATQESTFADVEHEYNELLQRVPNLYHPDTPIGTDDSQNVEIERVGEPTAFDFDYKDHVQLGKDLDIIDFETAADVTGAGFYYFKHEMVWLELALQQFALEKLAGKGYVPFTTPDMARGFVMSGTGFSPRGNEDQIYQIANEDLSLIATAEITLGGYYANRLLEEKDLPIKMVGISHCFRKEAGAYGKESRGLYRVHQFSKVEMFIICTPEQSESLHEEIKGIEKEIYTELGMPFRVMSICTGDLGAPAYRKYDLEAWMPMKGDFGEITSCSNCTDYQARRLNIKYKAHDETVYAHTLNGTAVNSSRIPLSILENFQTADGTVVIPKVLHKYLPQGMTTIKPKP